MEFFFNTWEKKSSKRLHFDKHLQRDGKNVAFALLNSDLRDNFLHQHARISILIKLLQTYAQFPVDTCAQKRKNSKFRNLKIVW